MVVGGADPTGRPEAYVAGNGHAPAVDAAVVGEAERTFVEVLARYKAGGWQRGVALDDVPGLAAA